MSKKLRFNVNAYTAKLIGRENVSNLEGAILELVKNTYDADATKCVLYYDEKNNVLYIMDNGVGMSEEIIERHWMTIGNSSKSIDFITKSGRVQTGAKGIGRFALDRTGDTCVMYTKNQESNKIIQWKVDWRDFDKKENLTDITAEIDYITGKLYEKVNVNENKHLNEILEQYFKDTGTIFKITNLREDWNIDLIKNIKKSLATLIPPDIENEFSIYFFYKEQNEKEALIISENIDAYDYKIQFSVYDSGKTIIKLDRNEFDFKDRIDDIIKKAKFKKEDKEYFLGKEKIINTTLQDLVNNTETKGLGKFCGVIYFNKISVTKEDTKKYYYKDITGRKNFSDIFGGIKLYRDNFRVRPYGEKDSSNYDWLLLGNRRAKSPAAISHPSGKWRVSADQISGIINISRMNVNLPDQANRQGIVETKEFKLLKEILIEIISKFEEDRQYVGRKLNKLYYEENETQQTQEEVRKKAEKQQENENNDEEDYKVDAGKVHRAFEEKDEQIRDLQDENRMLRNLATTGIVVNQYIHETKESVNNVGTNIMVIKELLTEDRDIEKAIKKINDAQKYVETMNSWYDVTLGSIRRDKRTMKFNDINSLISTQINLWKKVLERQNIDIIYNGKDIPDIKCFPFEIESIISNLIANSVYAFKGINNKKININLFESLDGIKIEYSDTGCGLIPEYREQPYKILEALETSKRNRIGEKIGTGMGMWIIAGIVKSYGGKIDLDKNKKEKIGFYIDIYLKALKRKEGGIDV